MLTNDTYTATNKSILIVDDDCAISELARLTLEKEGYTVNLAKTGSDAIDMLGNNKHDAVLLDLNLPDLHGIEVCKYIRNNGVNKSLPIMVLTGDNEDRSVVNAFDSGATEFTTKPVNWRILKERLQNLIMSNSSRDMLKQQNKSLASLVKAIPDKIIRMKNFVVIDHTISRDSTFFSISEQLRFHTNEILSHRNDINSAEHDAEVYCFESIYKCDNHNVYYEYRVVCGSDDNHTIIIRDVTEISEMRSRIDKLAYYDRVTNLPNSYMYYDNAASYVINNDHQITVIRLELPELDEVRNTLGINVYNNVLQLVSRRIKSVFNRSEYTNESIANVYNIDSSQFAVVYATSPARLEEDGVFKEISDKLIMPFVLDDYELYFTPAMGICDLNSEHSIESLLQCAGEVTKLVIPPMDYKKYMYTPEVRERVKSRLSLSTELRKALNRDELQLHYQPQIDAHNQTVIGFEALIRWNNDQHGFVSPDVFIPLAEENGLIVDIGDFVIDRACHDLAALKKNGYSDFKFAINMSSLQIHKHNLLAYIEECLSKHKLQSCDIEFELTETAFVDSVSSLVKILNQIKELGIQTALDDFGTGYSSLSYLSKMPFDLLKIDRSFISSINTCDHSSSLVEAIISIARSLNMNVLAEGVETSEQHKYLQQRGCDYIQGYYYSKPLDITSVKEFLCNHHAVA